METERETEKEKERGREREGRNTVELWFTCAAEPALQSRQDSSSTR